jgi:hypothetical protein
MRNLLVSFVEHKKEWKMIDIAEIIFEKESTIGYYQK